MEFHISRAVREATQVDDMLFSTTGNVVFANVAASRKLAEALNQARGVDADPAGAINAGALFAMGLIDELSHALVDQYRKQIDPAVLAEAVRWFAVQIESGKIGSAQSTPARPAPPSSKRSFSPSPSSFPTPPSSVASSPLPSGCAAQPAAGPTARPRWKSC